MSFLLGKFQIRQLILENPFWVLQMPTQATPQELRKHQQRLRLEMLDEGWRGPATLWVSPRGVPTEEQISAAFAQLENPLDRFLSELFWFWPDLSGAYPHDHQVWRNSPPDTDGAAGLHNLALNHQIHALTLEEDALKGDTKHYQHANQFWRSSWTEWRRLCSGSDASTPFWERLAGRIRDLDDPRLTTQVLLELRKTLTEAVESLAIDCLQNLFGARNKTQFQLLLATVDEAIGDGDFLQEGRLIDLLHGEEERARDLVVQQGEKILPISEQSKTAISVFLAEAGLVEDLCRNLATLTFASTDGNGMRASRASDVLGVYAKPLRGWFVAYYNSTGDSDACKIWLTQIERWDLRGPMKDVIEEDIRTVEGFVKEAQDREQIVREIEESNDFLEKELSVNVVVNATKSGYTYPTVCACCLGSPESTFTVGGSKTVGQRTQSLAFTFPICKECEEHQKENKAKGLMNFFAFVCVCGVTGYCLGSVISDLVEITVLGVVLAILVFLGLNLFKWPKGLIFLGELDPSHSHRGNPIELVNFTFTYVGHIYELRFFNPLYAKRFAEFNQGTLKEPCKVLRFSRGSKVYSGRLFRNLALGGLLGGTALCAALGALGMPAATGDSESHYSQPSPVPAQTTLPSATAAQFLPAPSPAPPSVRGPQLKNEIEGMRARLNAGEIEIQDMRGRLDALNSRILSSNTRIDTHEAQLRSGFGNRGLYQSEITLHNQLAAEYNNLKEEHNNRVQEYNDLLTRTRAAIDHYNNGF